MRRLIVTMPPRHGKSECVNVQFPGYFLGRFPERKVICATHTEKLSFGFGRKVRNLVRSEEYQGIFPETRIAKDSKAAGRWSTSKGGEYFAIGVGGALAGRGGDLMIIDDPHSEQDALTGGDTHYERVYDWFHSGPRQRLQPGGAIVVLMTRWSKKDLVGRLLAAARADRHAEQWEVLSLPAMLSSGEALFPEYWKLEELESIRRTLPSQRWNAQYQQNPTSDEASIVKRDWWRKWEWRPPKIEYAIQSWDTSFGEYRKGDPSACVDWGVFRLDQNLPAADRSTPRYAVILLDAYSARLPFPELKAKALELHRLKKPDCLCVEARWLGAPLLQELQRMGLQVTRYAPVAGDDKLTRMNAVSDLFRSGLVWYLPTPKADEVIEQFAEGEAGTHDDLADASVQALQRFREGGWLRLASDVHEFDDEDRERVRFLPPEEYY